MLNQSMADFPNNINKDDESTNNTMTSNVIVDRHGFEDDDGCSICLESFTPHNPSTVTTCKHEYHLHCILEWSQRSNECPICWRSLTLKDPVSQAAVDMERHPQQMQSHVSSERFTDSDHYPESDPEYEESQWTNDLCFNKHMGHHIAATMSRVQQYWTNEGQISSERGPVECSSSAHGSSEGSSHTRPRQNQADFTQKLRSLELHSVSESVKSRISAASNRYKDSFSKGTQGFREKFFARNNSVKELSKEVQREMNTRIAGVARMIERLDLKSKRNSRVGQGVDNSSSFSKGKGLLDDIIPGPCEKISSEQSHDDPHEKRGNN